MRRIAERNGPALLLAAGLGLFLGGVLAGRPFAAETCRMDRLDLRWGHERTTFQVEIADDPEERARGLMHRRQLEPSAGMLFVYEAPRPVAFWMKNTLIPLDMVFADERGRVVRVHSRAKPHDETPIEGGPGIQYVLEINGGLAETLGIGPGAVLRHPLIGAKAAWPC